MEFNFLGIAKLFKEMQAASQTGTKLVLVDRGFVDKQIMHHALLKSQKLSTEEFHALQSINCVLASRYPGNVIVGMCQPETSLRRDDKHSEDASGIIMNEITLQALHDEYTKLSKSAIYTFDTDEKDVNEYVDEIYELMLRKL